MEQLQALCFNSAITLNLFAAAAADAAATATAAAAAAAAAGPLMSHLRSPSRVSEPTWCLPVSWTAAAQAAQFRACRTGWT
jgi:hypothetical protein